MAYQTRLKPSSVLFHLDQGTHYTSKAYAESVSSFEGMKQSMSRKGNCWDNAPTERFFRSFKTEWMPKGGYEDIFEAKSDITKYIELEYNQTRIQKGLGYKTPRQVWFDFYRQAA